MNKLLLIIIFGISLISCNQQKEPTQQEYNKLRDELEVCKQTVAELSNTPQMRLNRGQNFDSQNKLTDAKEEYRKLIEKYPSTEEAKKANVYITEIERRESEKLKAEEKKKLLGFKAIKENSSISVGDIKVNFNNITLGNQWVFDSYGTEWRYRSAERGEIYILSKIAISSESKNPDLPPISVYKISNGGLTLLGTMDYEFSRWKDYGTYLGNYADFKNNFAYTKTIAFSCALPVSKTDIDDEAVFIVVKKVNCFSRSEDKFKNPPVSYSEGSCEVKSTLTVDDFEEDYILVKIFNKNKL